MAYDADLPPALVQQGVAGAIAARTFIYYSTDSIETISAAGYFTNGFDLGLREGDTVIWKNLALGQWHQVDLIVSDVTNEVVTVGIPEIPEEVIEAWATATGILNRTVSSLAELAALNVSAWSSATLIGVLGREGCFVKRLVSSLTTDEAAARTADTAQGVFVNSTDNVLYTWKRVLDGRPNEYHFGGHPSRTAAQRTAAINALFAFAVAAGVGCDVMLGTSLISTEALVFPEGLDVNFVRHPFVITKIYKGFNGTMATMAGQVRAHGLCLSGNKASGYTGAGIVIASGNDQWVAEFRIEDMDGACVDFTADGAGSRSRWVSGTMYCNVATDYAVRLPESELGTTGTRYFEKINTEGRAFIDVRGGNQTFVHNCIYAQTDGIRTTAGSDQSTRSKKLVLTESRPAGNHTFYGANHTISNNVFGGTVALGAAAFLCHVHDNDINPGGQAGVVTDNSGVGSNWVDSTDVSFTPVWEADGTDPAIGAGVLVGSFSRTGKRLHIRIALAVAADTTFGTSAWYFNLPLAGCQAIKRAHGTVVAIDVTGPTYYPAVCFIGTDQTKIYMLAEAATGFFSSTRPFTWATGDELYLDITVEIE